MKRETLNLRSQPSIPISSQHPITLALPISMAAYHANLDEVSAAVGQLRDNFHVCHTLAEQARVPTYAFAQLLAVRPTTCHQSMMTPN